MQIGMPKLLRTIRNTGIFSVVLALIPILSIYYSGIPGLNLADAILALLWLPMLYLLTTKKLTISLWSKSFDKQCIAIMLFVAYCISLLLVQVLVQDPQLVDITVRTTRIVFYLSTVLVLTPILCNPKTVFTTIKIVSLLAASYLLMQVIVFRATGVVVRGYVPFWPLYTPQDESFDLAGYYMLVFHRPTSFFLEPAHFSRYASLGLAAFLIGTPRQKHGYISILAALFITLAIAMSTSSIGMVLAGFLWTVLAFGLIRKWFKQRQNRKMGLLLMCALLGLCIAFLFSSTLQFVVSRSLNFGAASAFDARLGSMLSLIHEPSLLKVFFGHGYGSVPAANTWMSGTTYILYGTGILGLCLILFSLGYCFFRKSSSFLDKILTSLVFLLLFVDDSFNSVIVVLLYSLALFGTQKAAREQVW